MKKRKNYLLQVILTAITVLFVQAGVSPLLGAEKWVSAAYVKDGAIYTGKANSKLVVRAGPGTSYDRVDVISNGEKVNTYETRNGWVRISLPDVTTTALKDIFVPEDQVAKKPATEPAKPVEPPKEEQWVDSKYIKDGMVTTGNPAANLAVRSGPGKEHSTVKTVPDGEKVTAYETRNGWVRISPDPEKAVAAKGSATSAKPAYLLNFSALLLLFLRKK